MKCRANQHMNTKNFSFNSIAEVMNRIPYSINGWFEDSTIKRVLHHLLIYHAGKRFCSPHAPKAADLIRPTFDWTPIFKLYYKLLSHAALLLQPGWLGTRRSLARDGAFRFLYQSVTSKTRAPRDPGDAPAYAERFTAAAAKLGYAL